MISAVIPVYNSSGVVAATVQRVVKALKGHGFEYEVILVNDGSRDDSWKVIADLAKTAPHVTAINLLHNYGQHTALFCGLKHASGDCAITLDDDLQNPPEEMIHLIRKAEEGHDLVVGRFHEKEHSLHRKLGSILIGQINRRVFGQPEGLVMSNFRLLRRDVVERICQYKTVYPYITGMALLCSANPVNVWVDHQKREIGKSNYSTARILALTSRILFNYSSFPLRLVCTIGFLGAAFSVCFGLFFVIRGILHGSSVPGWTSLVVLLSLFNGFSFLVMGMLGEYIIRVMNQTSANECYHVRQVISHDD